MEAGAFKEQVGCSLGHAGIESAEDAGDAFRFCGVAYHQVGGAECALHAVEGCEFITFRRTAHDHFRAAEPGCIEAVERLPESVQDIVCHVDDVVDRTQANGRQALAKPLGAFSHAHAAHCQAAIADASVGVAHVDADG